MAFVWLLQEFQRVLGSKQPSYDSLMKQGKELVVKSSDDSDTQTIGTMLTSLKSKWTNVCGKSVDRWEIWLPYLTATLHLWVPVGTCKYLWAPVSTCGHLWAPVSTRGHLWVPASTGVLCHIGSASWRSHCCLVVSSRMHCKPCSAGCSKLNRSSPMSRMSTVTLRPWPSYLTSRRWVDRLLIATPVSS